MHSALAEELHFNLLIESRLGLTGKLMHMPVMNNRGWLAVFCHLYFLVPTFLDRQLQFTASRGGRVLPLTSRER